MGQEVVDPVGAAGERVEHPEVEVLMGGAHGNEHAGDPTTDVTSRPTHTVDSVTQSCTMGAS